MAFTGFNPAQYSDYSDINNLIAGQQAQYQQDKRENIAALAGSINQVGEAFSNIQLNKIRKDSVDENGNFDQNRYLQNLNRINPELAMQEEMKLQALDAKRASIQKTRYEADKLKNDTIQASIKTHIDAGKYIAQQASIASNQSDYDKIINTLKSSGLSDVSEYEGREFTPQLKAEMIKLATDYAKQAELELQKYSTVNQGDRKLDQADQQISNQYELGSQSNDIRQQQVDNTMQLGTERNAIDAQQAQNTAQRNQIDMQAKTDEAKSKKFKEITALQEKITKSTSEMQDAQSILKSNALTIKNGEDLIQSILDSDQLDAYAGGGKLSEARAQIPADAPLVGDASLANIAGRFKTLASKNFLTSVKQMKGLGALSDAEGQKLSAAMGSFDPNQSKDEIVKNLNILLANYQDFKNALREDYNAKLKLYKEQKNNYNSYIQQ